MTAFPELDELLADLVTEQRRILGASFVATYLVGSFAVGDADEWSDVDFITVVEEPRERHALDELHARLFTRETGWAQHLEGSYAPREQIRRKTNDAWWFLDNGSTQLVEDTHDNLWAIRWATRAHGITLAGPSPAELIDPVDPAAIQAEAQEKLEEYVRWAHEPHAKFASGMSRWTQPYLVLTLCRILYTREHATVVSKRRSAEWAREQLPEWRTLIDAALADRPHPWERVHEAADHELAARTLVFADSLI